ncbi:hypothetical protein QFZ52_002593 [Arthrobacter woluwensis]|uniref:hypothetical protein n=1 Tax=Arthrobacter woluwensis TaxID=156980 RepID=UPI00277D7952|nr:hypothetical protein [Arthrobacter woluwensis]MDQ0709941.1 hypothetical protein [Arthrobacter woluwensis]
MSTPEFNNQGGPETPGQQNPERNPWGPPGQYQGQPQGQPAQQVPGQYQGGPQSGTSAGAPYGGAGGQGQQYGQQPAPQQNAPDYGRQAPGAGYPGPGYTQAPGAGHGASVSQQPEGGKALLGPLTLRDVLVLVAVVLLLVSNGLGNFGRLGFIPSLEFLGLDMILPLAVGVGFVIRRVSPTTKLRLGSFSLDQLASVLASLALLGALSRLSVLPFLGYYAYINWTSVILSLLGAALLFVTTVLARFIPVFAADFTGRPEAPAHVVARDAAPANRPAQPVHSGPSHSGPAAQQYPSTPGYGNHPGGPAQGGAPQGAPSPYAPQGYQSQQSQQGSAWAAPAAAGAAGVGAAAAGHGAPAAEPAESPTDDAGASPSGSRHRAPEAPGAPEGTVEGLGEGVGEARDAGSAASADEPSPAPAAGAAGSDPETVTSSDAGAAAAEVPSEEPSSTRDDSALAGSDPILGDEVLATADYDASEGPSEDDLLKEAQSRVAEAPELPEPVLGVPTLNEPVEEPEEEEFFAPHPDDDSDVTVLRSALNTGSAPNTGAGSASAGSAEPAEAEEAAPAGSGSADPIHAVVDPHREAEQPAQQAFWFAVPERRVALDERSGAPVFDLEPGKWILALQEGPQGLVVQNEDGRIGVLHDLRSIERGS